MRKYLLYHFVKGMGSRELVSKVPDQTASTFSMTQQNCSRYFLIFLPRNLQKNLFSLFISLVVSSGDVPGKAKM